MITGHFGLAVGIKKYAPHLPLWSLFLATFWLDILFMSFSIFGFESFTPLNPDQPAYGEVVINAQYTHSLAGAALIAVITGWLASLRWKKAGGTVIGAVIFSHWLLDLLVHRPDLPILPGNIGDLPLLGLGLWGRPLWSAILELVLLIAGACLYHRSAMSLSGQTRRAWTASLLTSMLLLILFVSSLMGL
jgi:hypothetical protein